MTVVKESIQPKQLIKELLELQLQSESYVFRGVSKAEQNNPTIKRVRGNDSNEYFDLSHEEMGLLYDFMHLGSPYFNKNLDTLDYIAIAQHYEIPTRLLDWTFDPYVALYFSISRVKFPDDGIYRIFYTDLSRNLLVRSVTDIQPQRKISLGMKNNIEKYIAFVNTIESDLYSFAKSFKILDDLNLKTNIRDLNFQVEELRSIKFDKYDDDGTTDSVEEIKMKRVMENKLLFFNAAHTNDRLIAQQGIFSIPKSLEGEKSKEEVENLAECYEFSLTEKNRVKVIEYLEKMNYKSTRLFPELSSLGQALKERKLKENYKKLY